MTTLNPSKLKLSAVLMVSTIILIAGFQSYWIKGLYEEVRDGLKKETDVAFRDVTYKLQLQRFRKDTAFFKTDLPDNLFMFNMMDSVKRKFTDTLIRITDKNRGGRRMVISMKTDIRRDGDGPITDSDELPPIQAPLNVRQIDSAYKKELLQSRIDIPFSIRRVDSAGIARDTVTTKGDWNTTTIYVGLSGAYAYQAVLANPRSFILHKLLVPFLIGIFLLGFTTLSFVIIYRNLLEQQRLAVIKNEFIGNMTHELKTPIATVTVAVEALKNFSALDDPERTKEYLDISALELGRLSMLVDQVLQLSLFESKEMAMGTELVDLSLLAEEVITSMKLQIEAADAQVQLTKSDRTPGELVIRGDRLHMTSVLVNLLDNALKYSVDNPDIQIRLDRKGANITLTVSDNGIGIPPAFQERIFEKFFRAPVGDHHDVKGYGLGLSFVRHIITRFGGTIVLLSKEGKGSAFIIQLPAV